MILSNKVTASCLRNANQNSMPSLHTKRMATAKKAEPGDTGLQSQRNMRLKQKDQRLAE